MMDSSQEDKSILAMVRSPASGARLQPASVDLVECVNQAIAAKSLQDQSGTVVGAPIESGLVDMKKRCLFPVRQGITILVSDQAISLSGFDEVLSNG